MKFKGRSKTNQAKLNVKSIFLKNNHAPQRVHFFCTPFLILGGKFGE